MRSDAKEYTPKDLEAIKNKYKNPGEITLSVDELSGRLADEILRNDERTRRNVCQ